MSTNSCAFDTISVDGFKVGRDRLKYRISFRFHGNSRKGAFSDCSKKLLLCTISPIATKLIHSIDLLPFLVAISSFFLSLLIYHDVISNFNLKALSLTYAQFNFLVALIQMQPHRSFTFEARHWSQRDSFFFLRASRIGYSIDVGNSWTICRLIFKITQVC